ncbi:hypothetical protein [Shimia sagamensis]|uniref:Uncharacterized protein n=1 Tax=Shimia sagamensis TaxID=1566352 RepID=A0ABY1P9P4_9RHOB|nr:hypothetical protein [Shimia sagamensis]SMP29620.1 hypothetical protein SAMN06265373_106262 [Shimia sagamensis]
MQVSSSERGLVRLFAVDVPSEEIEAFRAQVNGVDGALLSWPLKEALGFTYLDEDFIELFPVSDLEEMGLTGYMVEGLGIAQKDVAEDSARLAAQKGWVLIVLSAAFDGVAQSLSPKAPLRWIGTYKEDGAPVHFEPLPDASAKGPASTQSTVLPAPSSNPHLTLLLAILALPLVALVLGAFLFWIL